jgi:hypothetical protein
LKVSVTMAPSRSTRTWEEEVSVSMRDESRGNTKLLRRVPLLE